MIFKVICLGLALFSGLVSAASDPVSTLGQLLDSNRNIKGDFHQVTYNDKGKQVQVSDGNFLLATPNQFVWDSVSPYEQRIISDGKTVLVWDVDLQQATKRPLSGAVGSSPAALLSQSTSKVLPHYVITQLDATEFQLAPKDQDNIFKTLTLSFKDKKISTMKITDGLGQVTDITFTKIQTHHGVAQANFSLDVPSDVDVIVEGQ